jgi:AbrB family looped-hinge helix DNA binding protein
MGAGTKETIKMKVFPKGQVVIPVSLRKKYQIDIVDRLDVISKSDGILLKPLPKENRQMFNGHWNYGVRKMWKSWTVI